MLVKFRVLLAGIGESAKADIRTFEDLGGEIAARVKTLEAELVADFSGYRARPALSSLLAWSTYWGVVLLAWRRGARG